MIFQTLLISFIVLNVTDKFYFLSYIPFISWIDNGLQSWRHALVVTGIFGITILRVDFLLMHRCNVLIIAFILNMIMVFMMAIFKEKLVVPLLYISPAFYLVAMESFFNNMFFRTDREFIILHTYAVPVPSLIMVKNLNNYLVVVVPNLVTQIVLIWYFQISIPVLGHAVLFMCHNLFYVLMIGNIISVLSHKGAKKRPPYSMRYFFVQQFIVAVASVLFFALSYLKVSLFLWGIYYAYIVLLYAGSVILTKQLATRFKYNLLELE